MFVCQCFEAKLETYLQIIFQTHSKIEKTFARRLQLFILWLIEDNFRKLMVIGKKEVLAQVTLHSPKKTVPKVNEWSVIQISKEIAVNEDELGFLMLSKFSPR